MAAMAWTGPHSLADDARLRAVAEYDVLDTCSEERFDRITRLVAAQLEMPVALVTVAHPNRIWYKSRFGTQETETNMCDVPAGAAFCAEVVSHNAPLVVEDARQDPRFAEHPYVIEGPIRFYAGVPLRAPSGHVLGTLCVIDGAPRTLTSQQLGLMETLAESVVAELELTRQARQLAATRRRLVSAVDALHEGLLIVDGDGRIEHASVEAGRLLGFAVEELVGAPVGQMLPEMFSSVLPGGTLHPEIATDLSVDVEDEATGRWFTLKVRPFEGGWTVIIGDVTAERKEALDLREKEEGFRALAENSADVIARYGRDLRMLYVNPAIERATGLPRAELIGRRTRDLQGEKGAARFEGWLNRAFRTGKPHRKAFRRATPDGLRDFEITFVPEFDDRHEVASVLTTARDVTESRRAQEQLRLLESAVTHAHDGVVITDTQLSGEGPRILYANDALLRLTGYTAEEVRGKTPRLFQGPDTCAVARARIREALEAGRPVQQEILNYTKDGTPYWVEVFIAPVNNPEGAATHFISIQRDVTGRKAANEQLATANARYQALSRLISAYAFAYRIKGDGQWRTEWTTDTIEDVLGYTAQEVNTMGPQSLIHPDDLERWEQRNTRLVAGEEVTEEYRIRRRAGDYRWIKVSAYPERDDSGTVMRVYGAAQDVTDQHEAEAVLLDAKERAEEAARLKDAFLANMSHEIRTPLTGILGFTEILKDEVSGEHQQLVSMIESGGRRLMETLTSVLELSRLQAGRAVMHIEDVDLVRIAVETVGLFAPQASQRGIEILFSLDENVPRVLGDRGALTRVVSNLINNAIKFTDRGTIRVSLRGERGRVALHVSDTGRGIAPEFLPHLFDEFRQESTGLTRSHEGAGLGLAITRRLVDMMDGTIEVQSVPGAGTTFSVYLPVFRPAPARLSATPEGPALPGGPATPEGPAKPPASVHGRVLIVEDTDATRMFAERALRSHCHLDAVASAQAALELTQHPLPYDVVLLDINLGPGGISGEELLPLLRLSEACRDAHVIAMTAYALPGDRERFLRAGFDGYLPKPFTRADLVQAVTDVVQAAGA